VASFNSALARLTAWEFSCSVPPVPPCGELPASYTPACAGLEVVLAPLEAGSDVLLPEVPGVLLGAALAPA
jgi:hypothetical protein